MMKQQEFYTNEFYSNPLTTQEVFNRLLKESLIQEKEMYKSGEFLFVHVFNNEKAKEILSILISDFGSYIKYNNSKYMNENESIIGLPALQEDHKYHFEREDEIMWEDEIGEFVTRGQKENDDEDW